MSLPFLIWSLSAFLILEAIAHEARGIAHEARGDSWISFPIVPVLPGDNL